MNRGGNVMPVRSARAKSRAALFLSLAAVAALVLAPGCKKKPEATLDAGAAPAVPKPTQAWLDGVLPESVNEGTPKDGGTLTIRVSVEPAGLTRLHDQMVEDTMSRYTVGPIYETLGAVDRAKPDGPLKPGLATGWEETSDHLKLTINLRKGVTFHDGTPFSAKDVKATLDTILDPKNMTASVRSYLEYLKSIETPDAQTVVITWKKPYFLADRTLLGAIPILPAHALEGDFNELKIHRAPIGTGPFRFVKWDEGKQIVLARNDAYWGPRAHLDKVVIRFVRDETVAAQLWEKGDLDLMTRIPPGSWRALEKPEPENAWAITGYHRIRFEENTYSWIGWNEKRPFFADARVRRALAMLYPAEVVANRIDLGLEPRTTCPYYVHSASCDGSVKPLPYDPKAAKKLLDEAGWKDTNGDGVRDKDGVPFSFKFLATPYSVKLNKLAPLMQEELRKAGIDMTIEKVDASVYVARLQSHDFDAAALSWSSQDAVQDIHQVFHSSQAAGGSNYVSYANPRVDALLERIRVELDPAARHALEKEVHRALYDDQVYLFLSVRPTLDAVKTRVHGIAPSIAWYDLATIWVE